MANGVDGTNMLPAKPSSQEEESSEFAMLYYGLGIVALAGLLLLAYNVIIVKCYADRGTRRRVNRIPALVMMERQRRGGGCQGPPRPSQLEDLPSYKYQKKKDEESGGGGGGGHGGEGGTGTTVECPCHDHECAVCLSIFEDGEEIKQLPRCKHSFHAPCIDMWLCSHLDCPICRSTI